MVWRFQGDIAPSFVQDFISVLELTQHRERNAPSRTIDVIGHQGKADTIAYGEIAIK